ncbi:hypothetical protein [Cryobacterium sp. MP_M3]
MPTPTTNRESARWRPRWPARRSPRTWTAA